MSGKAIAMALMRLSDPLTAVVPEANMIGSVVPLGAEMPAIGAVRISRVYDRPLRRGATRHVTERVQVTWLANDATKQSLIGPLVVSAIDGKLAASLVGVTRVSALVDGGGPDFVTDGGLHGGSIDFLVSYSEAA